MNTNDEKIQWHPAFDAVLQIEFGDEAKYPEFDPEHFKIGRASCRERVFRAV